MYVEWGVGGIQHCLRSSVIYTTDRVSGKSEPAEVSEGEAGLAQEMPRSRFASLPWRAIYYLYYHVRSGVVESRVAEIIPLSTPWVDCR